MNLVVEARVSAIVDTPNNQEVPHVLWRIEGELPPDPEDDGVFDAMPIQEKNESGMVIANQKYKMSSLPYEYFQSVISNLESTELSQHSNQSDCVSRMKALYDELTQSGHEVLLFETCDF